MKHRIAVSLATACLPAAWALADQPEAEAAPVAEAVAVEAVAIEAQELIVAVERAEAAEQKEEAKPAAEEDKAAGEKIKEADLRKKMRELERELQDARNQFQQKANEQRAKAKQDAIKALDDIKLPKNPTREQCEAYVAELRKACEGRRSFSSSDPATKKLKQLPPEHYDLLITEMANRTSLRYYANYAMREIDPEQLRERFVNSLKDNPNNIGIIVMHGWCEDVRPDIINHMQNADGSISPAWFQAAVELDEPSLYPKLHEITTQSRYAGQFITMLEMLPEYDLAHTIDVCWRRAREGKLSVSFTTFAAKAAEFGNAEALGSLIDQLQSSSSYLSHASTFNARRTNVLRYIDYRGSNKDIQQWYRANKDKLVFDHLRKRFYIPKDF
ncbi:MAG: hypothetical protein AAGB26_02135 [Planctomycetota bacterium]